MDSENGVVSLSEKPMSKSTVALGVLALVAAMPLIWFAVDVQAGERLLKFTQFSPPAQTAAH